MEERREALAEGRGVSDVGDLTADGKWKFLDAERYWANRAFAFTAKSPAANYGHE